MNDARSAHRRASWSRRRLFGPVVLGASEIGLSARGGAQRGTIPGPSGGGSGSGPPDVWARFAAFAPADEPNGDLAEVV